MITKLTSKVENNDENMTILSDQLKKRELELKQESEKFEIKLGETQKYFEETLREMESEVTKLRTSIRTKDEEIHLRDNDLCQIIKKHENDIQRIMAKGEVNIQDPVIQMLEQRLKDLNEVLNGKIKVIEVIQKESTEKESKLTESYDIQKSFKEKLQVMSEQMMLFQANFVDMETQWRDDKKGLDAKIRTLVEKHEEELSEKDIQIHSLQTSLNNYETAYTKSLAQYNALQSRYHQTMKPGGAVALGAGSEIVPPSIPVETQQEFTQLKADLEERAELLQMKEKEIEKLKSDLSSKDREMQESHKKSSSKTDSKGDAKMLKMKAQMTTKIKSLEKELEEFRKVSSWISNNYIYILNYNTSCLFKSKRNFNPGPNLAHWNVCVHVILTFACF